jgi:hypothetical protein
MGLFDRFYRLFTKGWKPNVIGSVTAPHGLSPVLNALRPLFPHGEIFIGHPLTQKGEKLIVRTTSAFFSTNPHDEEGRYIFAGGVEGTLDEVIAFTKALSDALELAGIEHDLHVYDSTESIVASFPKSNVSDESKESEGVDNSDESE